MRQLASQRYNFIFLQFLTESTWNVHQKDRLKLPPTPDCKREAKILWSCKYNFPSGKTLWWEWEDFHCSEWSLNSVTVGVTTCCVGEFANTHITTCLIPTQISLHCLKKLPSNLVQTEQLQCLAPNIVIQWAAVVCTWCIQTAVACKSSSHSRKLFLCFSSCQKSWMWQQAGMGMLLTAPSSCPLSSPNLYTTEKTSLLSQEHL